MVATFVCAQCSVCMFAMSFRCVLSLSLSLVCMFAIASVIVQYYACNVLFSCHSILIQARSAPLLQLQSVIASAKAAALSEEKGRKRKNYAFFVFLRVTSFFFIRMFTGPEVVSILPVYRSICLCFHSPFPSCSLVLPTGLFLMCFLFGSHF